MNKPRNINCQLHHEKCHHCGKLTCFSQAKDGEYCRDGLPSARRSRPALEPQPGQIIAYTLRAWCDEACESAWRLDHDKPLRSSMGHIVSYSEEEDA